MQHDHDPPAPKGPRQITGDEVESQEANIRKLLIARTMKAKNIVGVFDVDGKVLGK